MADEETKKLVKRPTAAKRGLQDEKKCAHNKAFIAKLRTVKTNFDKAEGQEKKSLLSSVFSLLDKAQKRGLYKRNKTARLKSRLSAKV
jgi:small subunit ribosomal protein S20